MAQRRPDYFHRVRLLGKPGEGRDAALITWKLGEPHEELLELRCRGHEGREETRKGNPPCSAMCAPYRAE